MYLVPKKEQFSPKITKNAQTNSFPQAGKTGSTYIGQLNQTKIEDGGLQKIISTCDKASNELESVNITPDFPNNQTFKKIDNAIDRMESIEDENDAANDAKGAEDGPEKKDGYNEVKWAENDPKKEEGYNEVEENNSEESQAPDAEFEPSIEEPGLDNLTEDVTIEDNLTNNTNADETTAETVDQTENSEKPSIHSEEPSDKYQLWEERTKFLKNPDLWEDSKLEPNPGKSNSSINNKSLRKEKPYSKTHSVMSANLPSKGKLVATKKSSLPIPLEALEIEKDDKNLENIAMEKDIIPDGDDKSIDNNSGLLEDNVKINTALQSSSSQIKEKETSMDKAREKTKAIQSKARDDAIYTKRLARSNNPKKSRIDVPIITDIARKEKETPFIDKEILKDEIIEELLDPERAKDETYKERRTTRVKTREKTKTRQSKARDDALYTKRLTQSKNLNGPNVRVPRVIIPDIARKRKEAPFIDKEILKNEIIEDLLDPKRPRNESYMIWD